MNRITPYKIHPTGWQLAFFWLCCAGFAGFAGLLAGLLWRVKQ